MSLKRILTLNLLGLLILFSWWQTTLPIWPALDEWIFFSFNHTITEQHPLWVTLLGALNTRIYDAATFFLMLFVLVLAMFEDKRPARVWHWFSIGFVMLASAGIIALINNKLPYAHESPSLFFHDMGEHVNYVSQMVSFKAKDSAGDSFPGDHGMMLLVFTSFVMRYAPRKWTPIAIIMALCFSMPRIIVGAHWFEDVYMASLAIGLIYLPWVLMTPLSDRCIRGVERLLRLTHLPGTQRL
ncbi:phosphatase PAP2 family protein [Carnimonas bestiolae]|uniref:phosphatase PAP2 family protein n=1 Tax=Carnimonas bestiolae TaxID=3402172 RepID=UPI003EDBB1F5